VIGQGDNEHRDSAARRRAHPRAAATIALLSLLTVCLLTVTTPTALAAPPAQFGAEGSGAGEFIEPNGIAVEQESGDLYIADRNNSRIDKFGPEGEFLFAFGWGVADGTSEALQTCTATCFGGLNESPFTGPGPGQLNFPEGIAVDNNPSSPSHGDVYVADTANNRVQKFGPEGEFLLMFGGEVDKTTGEDVCTAASGDECGEGVAGTGPGRFEHLSGRSVAIDSSGAVYVGDENRVQRFSPAGGLEAQISLPGAGFVENLAVDSAGDLYVQSPELPGISKYDSTGTELGTPRDEAGEPSAIALGPSDELFIDDGQNLPVHHIFEYDPSGIQTASFDAGEKDGNRGIAYSEPMGLLYVLNRAAVRLLSPPPPGPLILPASESSIQIQPTSATLKATLNPEGAETEYHFEYGLADCEGGGCESTPTETLSGDFEDHEVSAAIEALAPRTAYHFRLVASNVDGEVKGPDQTFETLPPVSVDSVSASGVSATGATLEATLNPHGLSSTYRFEYDTVPYAEGEAPHGTAVPVPDGSLGSADGDVSRSAVLEGLASTTTYHYRVLAENALGAVQSADHSFTTQGFAAALLPDGRQWEMVSPPNKHGSPLQPLTREGATIQAAAGGAAFTYVAQGPIDPDPAGNRGSALGYNQELSERGPGAWSSEEITTPNETPAIVLAGFPAEYRAFSEDLSASLVQAQGSTPLSPLTTERTPYLREADGQFVPLVDGANVAEGVEFGCEEEPGGRCVPNTGVELAGANSQLTHVVLKSTHDLVAGFELGGSLGLYEWTAGLLRPASILPGGEFRGAALGDAEETITRGSVSDEGDRVVFTVDHHLYLRDMTLGQTVQLDAPQGGTGGSGAQFQAANRDASKVFFTSDAALSAEATAQPSQPDLYECKVEVVAGELACTLRDLTATAGAAPADVQQTVAAIDASGTHVYFAANGTLAPGAKAGSCAQESEGATCNLYVRDTATEETHLVAELSGLDAPDWNGHGSGLGTLTARTSPDGRYFAFMSARPLTGYDNRDVVSGQRDEEVFLYDFTNAALECVSCNPTGARPVGVFAPDEFPGLLIDRPRTWPDRWLAASIPGWTLYDIFQAAHQSRYLSNSGRMFFNSADALVPQDSNGVADVYQYEPPGLGDCSEQSPSFSPRSGGCVSLISSGASPKESAFLDASESGEDAFFLTAARLSSTDIDTAFDVYDAHVCRAESPCFPAPPPPAPECDGDACQQPATPPAHPTPGTALLNGPGNVTQCPKGKVRRAGRCAKRQAKKHHKKKHRKRVAHHRRAAEKRGRAGR
jgi:DNA-binding beta-propeller fold protein YncE